jgi:[acyl-carrier-protein] S-malonyltransferase
MFAAIFPGQGAQFVGMGKDVAERHAAAREVFQAADRVLETELSAMCFDGPADRLNATDVQQPAIFVTSVACFRAAIATGLVSEADAVVMGGLSLGEYTALHLAGAMEFDVALRLVQRRGQLMQQAAEASRGGMLAVMGLDEAAALELCERAAASGRLRPANFNCPGQIVLSGDAAAVEAATALVGEFGGKGTALKVAGAFHSELMRPAAEALRAELAAAEIRSPRVPVMANVDASLHTTPDSIRELLVQQVCGAVRWQECMQAIAAKGITEFCEFGPGRVLAGFNRKIDRNLKTRNFGAVGDYSPVGP